MTNEDLWKAALGEIEVSISKMQFNAWFRGASLLSCEKGVASLTVRNGFAKEWLENKFNTVIIRTLNNLGASVREVKCAIDQSDPAVRNQGIDAVYSPGNITRKQSASRSDLPDLYRSAEYAKTRLNPRYTFEGFIVGENNNLAHAACTAISESPGTVYNPLFVYGGVGLGKTHLLQSIGNRMLQKNPRCRVLYTTSEQFTHELIESIKNHTADAFKAVYRAIDLLIIDDVQFLAGREKTQHEFFNIFNALYQNNKQIVMSSDRPPTAIGSLEDRLRSRFSGGMIADISRPDLETRIAILSAKARKKSIPISDEVLRVIAENITHNIRELEGVFNRIVAIAEFSGRGGVTVEDAQKEVAALVASAKKPAIGHREILSAVCTFYEVSEDDLIRKGRKKEVAHPRQVAMYLLRSETNAPYVGIGRRLGGRDHTTVLHAYEKITRAMEKEEKLCEEIAAIKEKIYTF